MLYGVVPLRFLLECERFDRTTDGRSATHFPQLLRWRYQLSMCGHNEEAGQLGLRQEENVL